MLTCQFDWQSRTPGYVYWKGIAIEHLGPMGENWANHDELLGEWYSWKDEMTLRCQKLESLQVPVNMHTILQYEWFELAEKKEDIWWFDYFVYLGDFYLRGENEIAFLKTTISQHNDWIEEVIIYIWNKETLVWSEERCTAYCPDVAYHALIKMGWKHGCKFWGEKSVNIISHSWSELCGCFSWYNLPRTYPYLTK